MGRRQKSQAEQNVNSRQLVARLLEDEHQELLEATVHATKRSRIFVATFTGSAGGQVWRSTGLTDYDQALQLARHWEAQAAAQRAKLRQTPNKSGPRIRPAGLTQKEVARILKMSERGVRAAERRALLKLRSHPLLREFWKQYTTGTLDEDGSPLLPLEIFALFDLAQDHEELQLVEKTLALISC